MKIQSRLSGHWTDERIIDYLYGGDPDADHLQRCPDCLDRLFLLQRNRQVVEETADCSEPAPEFLAAQRRRIYAQLEKERINRRPVSRAARLASAAALLIAAGGGLFVYRESAQLAQNSNDGLQMLSSAISDSQLVTEVAQIADQTESGPTEPLRALFAE